jgi:chaperonin cofactor prefoldin
MAIEGGSGANSGLRVITKSLGALVDQFGELPPAVGGTVTILAGLGGALLLAGAGWVKYRATIAKVNAELIATGPAGEKAAAGLSKASKAAGIAGGVFLGLEVVGAVFDHFGPAATNVDKLAAALDNFSSTGQVSGELADAFGANLSGLNISATTAVSGLSGFTGAVNDLGNSVGISPVSDWLASITGTTSINKATENMAAYDAALTQVMTTSGDAKKASDLWNSALQRSGLDTDQLAKVLPDAYKKVGELNTQAMKTGGSVGALGKAEDTTAAQSAALADEMKKQKEEAAELENQLEALFKKYMSADQAEIALKDTRRPPTRSSSPGRRRCR